MVVIYNDVRIVYGPVSGEVQKLIFFPLKRFQVGNYAEHFGMWLLDSKMRRGLFLQQSNQLFV